MRQIWLFALFGLAPACGGKEIAVLATPLGSSRVLSAPVCPAPGDRGSARCHALIVVDELGAPRVGPAPKGLTPADLRDAYKITAFGSATTTIALILAFDYPNAESDLAVYRSQFGLPPCTRANGCFKKVNQDGIEGNYPPSNLTWSREGALDLQVASAICPGCSLLLVEGSLATAVNTAARLGALVISNSYGQAESPDNIALESAYNHPGIAITASAGNHGFGVQFPANSPHVIAVGGTTLVRSTNARGWEETAWSGSGSGCSTVFAKPSWQTDQGCANRTIADVSAVADPDTGVAIYAPQSMHKSRWMTFGGTSVGAPLVGAIYALSGDAATYASDPYAHAGDLFDITTGSNGDCGNYLCNAGPGYDGPTGLGTPNGINAF